jgi:hypothetical protein
MKSAGPATALTTERTDRGIHERKPHVPSRYAQRLLVASLTSFLVLLRQLVHLHGDEMPQRFADVLSAGERFLGPLPAMRRVYDHRRGVARLARTDLTEEFGRYLADVERIVAAIDTLRA